MLNNIRLAIFENFNESTLVNQCSHHIGVVVNRHVGLDYHGESPKSFFFVHAELKESSDNEIKTLAVAYFYIANGISK